MSHAIKPALVMGLSSGTSMDGIDAALVRIGGADGGELELEAFRGTAYTEELCSELRRASQTMECRQWALLDVVVGEVFAEAADALLAQAGVDAAEVVAIGSHGQTLIHLPELESFAGVRTRTSLQIGSASVIAERTGIATVSDFRARDMAAGGQGAPLVPFLDHRLYSDPTRGRVALNLGGIANLTALPPGAELADVTAFDTGPANVLLDAVARHRRVGAGFDEGGAIAATGTVDAALHELLMKHPFFDRNPPKSADTGDFLSQDVVALLHNSPLSDADLLATLIEVTAGSVAAAVHRFVAPHQPVDDLVVAGGGAHNRTLMGRIAELVAPARVVPCEQVVAGIPADAKEAVLFALLAHEALAGRPGNVPSATGASGPRVLGVIAPGV